MQAPAEHFSCKITGNIAELINQSLNSGMRDEDVLIYIFALAQRRFHLGLSTGFLCEKKDKYDEHSQP